MCGTNFESSCTDYYVNWLKAIIDSINDGILVIDSKGIVRLINDEYTRITGVTKGKIIGKELKNVRKGAILPKTLKDAKRRSGIYRKEGKSEYVVDMAPIYNGDEIVGAVSVCKSLTEVDYLTKELQQSREKLAKLEKAVGHIYQAKYTFDDILGKEGGLKDAITLAKKASHSELNILIQGESGTGKELVAHAIHRESTRARFPFVPVNCAALPTSLLESELFGYEEGSFTNSKKGGKIGLFELADHGTLFLDEIGDLPLELQAKLLRVLQDGKIRRIGGLTEKEIDVQVIAATNKKLGDMVAKQRFREDLYFRLNGMQIVIPPLRERKKDIFELINDMIHDNNPSIYLTEEAQRALFQYDWPGNVRELFNVLHYAVNMAEGNYIYFRHLPDSVKRQGALARGSDREMNLKQILKKTEQEIIQQTIAYCGDSLEGKKKAAKQLGISLATLYNKLNESVNSKESEQTSKFLET